MYGYSWILIEILQVDYDFDPGLTLSRNPFTNWMKTNFEDLDMSVFYN